VRVDGEGRNTLACEEVWRLLQSATYDMRAVEAVREELVAERAHICAILSECVSSCTADEKEGESYIYSKELYFLKPSSCDGRIRLAYQAVLAHLLER